jgi:ribosome-associated translation inhibitor RaiA
MKKKITDIFNLLGIITHAIAFYFIFKFSKDITTVFFVLIMLAVIVSAYSFGISVLYKMKNSLLNTIQLIKNINVDEKVNVWEHIRNQDNIFKEKHLANTFTSFKYEMDHLSHNNENLVLCDIADYINNDTIADSANRNYLEQVPGIMTGLGILGTFVGLAMGLQKFDASTPETMANSIPFLIDGIKIAFYTSIFGVALSLIYNFFYKKCIDQVNEAIDEFCDVFYEYVVPIPNNDMANRLLQYQESQTNAMQQFAETISIKIAESFKMIAAPTFNQITETMSDLSLKMARTQTDGMGEIVSSFIFEMNNSLGGQFEELGRVIRDMCKWQVDMVGDIQGMLDEIRNSSENMINVNIATEKILSNVDSFCDKLNQFQIGVNDAYESIGEQRDLFKDIASEQKECLEMLNIHENNLISKLEQINSRTEDIVKATISQIEFSKEISVSINNNMNKSADQLKTISETFNNDVRLSVTRTFDIFDNSLNDIAMHLSGTILEINETSQNIPKSLNEYFEQLKAEYQEYISSVSQIQIETKNVIHKLSLQVMEQNSNN